MPGVLAYHLILTNYGFWLPNDPRGSWSTFVRAFELYAAAGSATKSTTRASVASKNHDHTARQAAKSKLARPPVVWTGRQARAVSRGFADYATHNQHPVHALAFMPDHCHLVVGRTNIPIETLARQLKARATTSLIQQNLHPFSACTEGAPSPPTSTGNPKRLPTPWARHQWAVYLNTPAHIQRAIEYVNQNPIRAGHKPQHYTWITPYPPPVKRSRQTPA